VSQNTLGQMGQMVGWVGKEARVTAPVGFDGTTPVNVELAPRTGATKAILVAKDGAGTVVSQTEVAVQAGTYAWQGRDTDGNPLPKGSYTLSLTSLSATGELGSDAINHYERISEVRSGTSGVNLLLSNGTEIAATGVTAIREAAN